MLDKYNSTNAKSLNSYMGFAPLKITKGKGAHLYDENDRKFLDTGMALGSVSLGYAYDSVDNFVISEIKKGVNFSRPSILEEKLTINLQKDFGESKLFRYAKSSSVLLGVLPRICRYFTDREYIAYPDNCFLGNTDWYLSKSFNNGGILDGIKNKTLKFKNGDCSNIYELFEKHGHELACIIMEPYRDVLYSNNFYVLLSNLCKKYGVYLIFDETVTGYRFNYPLAQNNISCEADFTVIGKAFANGYALAAVAAGESLMSKIDKASIDGSIFDFSTTHAGETVGLAAAIKTLEVYRTENVINHISMIGSDLRHKMNEIIKRYSLESVLIIKGHPTYFSLVSPSGWLEKELKKDITSFFYNNDILYRGVISPCFRHTIEDSIKIESVFSEYCRLLVSAS